MGIKFYHEGKVIYRSTEQLEIFFAKLENLHNQNHFYITNLNVAKRYVKELDKSEIIDYIFMFSQKTSDLIGLINIAEYYKIPIGIKYQGRTIENPETDEEYTDLYVSLLSSKYVKSIDFYQSFDDRSVELIDTIKINNIEEIKISPYKVQLQFLKAFDKLDDLLKINKFKKLSLTNFNHHRKQILQILTTILEFNTKLETLKLQSNRLDYTINEKLVQIIQANNVLKYLELNRSPSNIIEDISLLFQKIKRTGLVPIDLSLNHKHLFEYSEFPIIFSNDVANISGLSLYHTYPSPKFILNLAESLKTNTLLNKLEFGQYDFEGDIFSKLVKGILVSNIRELNIEHSTITDNIEKSDNLIAKLVQKLTKLHMAYVRPIGGIAHLFANHSKVTDLTFNIESDQVQIFRDIILYRDLPFQKLVIYPAHLADNEINDAFLIRKKNSENSNMTLEEIIADKLLKNQF